jgi:hypothetical protein
LDLELEDIGKLPFAKEPLRMAGLVRKFIRCHQHVLAAFKSVADGMLVQPGSTRFATMLIGVESLVKHRAAVVATFSKESVLNYVKNNRNQKGSDADSSRTLHELYAEAKGIVSSDDFWDALDDVRSVMTPIAKVLRLADSDNPTASKIQYHMYEVGLPKHVFCT